MPQLLFILMLLTSCFCHTVAVAKLSICSWNVRHLGKSKGAHAIAYIATTISQYDLIAIQEVVSGADGGPVAVRKIVKQLNARKAIWKYTISEPTTSTNPYEAERYAYIYNTERVTLTQRLTYPQFLKDSIVREPFAVRFRHDGVDFAVVNYHAITKKNNPEREIKWFKYFPQYLQTDNIIFLGDYNVTDQNTVFNPLKRQGYQTAFAQQATTLRQRCIGDDCLASAYDHILYPTRYWTKVNAGVHHFYRNFDHDLTLARKISDHCPIYITLQKI